MPVCKILHRVVFNKHPMGRSQPGWYNLLILVIQPSLVWGHKLACSIGET